jgi:protein O-GlcNAc transferase
MNKYRTKLYKLWIVTLGWGFYMLRLRPRARRFSKASGKRPAELKVLEINTFAQTGGAARIASSLQSHLRRRGIEVSMLVSDIVPEHGEHVQMLESSKSKLQKWLFEFQQRKSWTDYFHLSGLGIKQLPLFKGRSLIHLHNLHGHYLSPFVLPELSAAKPLVWTLHDSLMLYEDLEGKELVGEMNPHPNLPRKAFLEIHADLQRIYQNSHLNLVVPSQWLKRKVETSILRDHPITVIPNGIDTKVFRPAESPEAKIALRKKLDLPEDKTLLIFAAYGGSANSWKGGEYLAEAYQHFTGNSDIAFINLGGKDVNEGIHNWINTGYIDSMETMRDYFAAADLMVYPSLFDSFGLVVVEAMACGIPVVAFATGGIPEIVKHGETGYIAKYRDSTDLIRGVELFLKDSAALQTAGLAARQIAIGFDIEKMVDRYFQLYNQVSDQFYNSKQNQ